MKIGDFIWLVGGVMISSFICGVIMINTFFNMTTLKFTEIRYERCIESAADKDDKKQILEEIAACEHKFDELIEYLKEYNR